MKIGCYGFPEQPIFAWVERSRLLPYRSVALAMSR